MTKARCKHKAPWFADCPFCDSERDDNRRPRQILYTFPFWRLMSAADAIAYIELVADDFEKSDSIVRQIREQMRKIVRAKFIGALCE